MSPTFPLAYRWLIRKNLVDWTPWYFVDDEQTILERPNLEKNRPLQEVYRQEFGSSFDVYLFARRQDQDEFAFLEVVHGNIVDVVHSVHLTFGRMAELKITPPVYRPSTMGTLPIPSGKNGIIQWVRNVVLPDVVDWMSEAELGCED